MSTLQFLTSRGGVSLIVYVLAAIWMIYEVWRTL